MKAKEFFDLYFQYVDKNTEAAFIFHRWSIIGGMAALLGRRTSVNMGHFVLYPNFYIQLLGSAGSRKSSAIMVAKNLIKDTGFKYFAGSRTTKEKFLWDLANQHTAIVEGEDEVGIFDIDLFEKLPSESFIVADEFNNFLGNTPEEFLGILSELWDMKDEWENKTSKGADKGSIYQPTINLLSGNTTTGFRSRFSGDLLTQGILTRLILVPHDTLRHKVAFPEAPDEAIKDQLLEMLAPMRNFSGAVQVTEEAKEFLGEVYTNWESKTPIYMESYAKRRQIHLMKLCLVFAALEGGDITLEVAIYANTCLAVVENEMKLTMQEVFESEHEKVIRHTVFEVCKKATEAGEAVSVHDIMSNIVQNQSLLMNNNIVRVQNIIEMMSAQNIIFKTTAGGYMLKKQVRSSINDAYIDRSLVTEDERYNL